MFIILAYFLKQFVRKSNCFLAKLQMAIFFPFLLFGFYFAPLNMKYCGGSFRIMYCYYYYTVCVSLIMAPVHEAVNPCRGPRRNPPNIRNKNAPVILENKINCSLTVVCASSFRPSQNFYFCCLCCFTVESFCFIVQSLFCMHTKRSANDATVLFSILFY
jgi:hypothetical protein